MIPKDLCGALKACPCGREHRASLPEIHIGGGLTDGAGRVLKDIGFPRALHIAADRNTLGACPGLPDALKGAGFTLRSTVFEDMNFASREALARIETESKESRALLAVGTGSLNDLCKLAAFHAGKPYAVFATAPSVDGFASGCASVCENGFKLTFSAAPPRAVLADTRVLAAAPARLRAAGFGDLLGKYTAIADWRISHLVTGEYFCENLARLTLDGVSAAVGLAGGVAGEDEAAAGALMEALCLSGFAMLLCGNSRPASGAEHHLSHFWEMLTVRDGKKPDLHGRKVGAAAVLVTGLYKSLCRTRSVSAACAPLPVREIERVFGSLSAGVLAENTPDPLEAVDPEALERSWDGIRSIVGALPDENALSGLLKRAGGACLPEQAGVGAGLVRDGMRYARYVRRRITLMRLSDMLR